MSNRTPSRQQNALAFFWGGLIGMLGGLIGLGGAEFRLPVLVGIFKHRTLQAIVINLAVSFVTVIFSFIFRTGLVNLDQIVAHSGIIINILAGSLLGAYMGVSFAARIDEQQLTRFVVGFLIFLSFILMSHTFIAGLRSLELPGGLRVPLGFGAGLIIGVFSSMLGVAGGEMIIPTILLVFAVDIKIAGSLSLAISIPTIFVGLLKYHQQGRLAELRLHKRFIFWMALGSIAGAWGGSYLLRFASSSFLHIFLGVILLISAFKLAREPHPPCLLG